MMSNRMKLKKGSSKKPKVETDKKELPEDNNRINSFLAAKRTKGSKPNNFTGKSSKVFSKKKT